MTEQIRVVRIIDRLNIGGPAKHVTWLTAGLNPERFQTTLITGIVPAGEGDMSYFARDAGVSPLVIKEMSRELSLGDIVVILKILRELLRLKPHIIHTHKAKAGAVGRVAALIYKWLTPSAIWLRPRKVGVVHTFHGHIFHSYYGAAKTRLFIAIERALARFSCDLIIAISEGQRDEICRKFKVGRFEQFRVIPLGIDFDEIKGRTGRLREEIGVGAERTLIGAVGRLCEVKNYAMLIESAAKLRAENLNAHLAVVGDGHLRAELEAQARAAGVSARVTFTGFRGDAASLYADFDIAALTSLNEGTPLTLIEAMSCGCAVATTEVGGVVDLMGARRETFDGFTIWDHGVTAPSRDVTAFANGLRFLIERPGLRREMGARGRDFVSSRLSKERLIGDIDGLYCDLYAEFGRVAPKKGKMK
ncbi:MAG TPA: glycosyltransferase [Blastocatellia bacterium]|nr:glycosyltransferase [Blastocatellia bacterium]